MWRGLAGVVEKYVKKGSKLYIEGKITNRQYEKDGETKYFTEIVANNMVMLDSKSDTQQSDSSSPQNENNQSSSSSMSANEPEPDDPGGEDDLPF